MDIPLLSDLYNLGKNTVWYLLKIVIKPLSYMAYVKPTLNKARDHLLKKYGKECVDFNEYALEIGDKGIEFERKKWRVYVPLDEALRGLKENRESILIQEFIKHSLLPEIDSVDKGFKEGLCYNETSEFLEKQKDGIQKQRVYYNKVAERNENNENLEIVSGMDANNSLQPLIKKISKELCTLKRRNIPIRKSPAINQRIKQYIKKAKAETKKILINDEEFDKLPDSSVIKTTPKSFFEHDRNFTENEVINCIITGKMPRGNTGKIISYCLIAQLVLEEPGLTSYKIAQKLGRSKVGIIYGITALLEHKNGLGFVKRVQQENHYLIYPTEKLRKKLHKKGFEPKQRELTGYNS